eukprot:snap_masked-scaffold_39-processed-gene-2.0-mRNA-1 protein AED:1.00 eAED:1.00 QI:0/0/0/0/1/1/2/0/255
MDTLYNFKSKFMDESFQNETNELAISTIGVLNGVRIYKPQPADFYTNLKMAKSSQYILNKTYVKFDYLSEPIKKQDLKSLSSVLGSMKVEKITFNELELKFRTFNKLLRACIKNSENLCEVFFPCINESQKVALILTELKKLSTLKQMKVYKKQIENFSVAFLSFFRYSKSIFNSVEFSGVKESLPIFKSPSPFKSLQNVTQLLLRTPKENNLITPRLLNALCLSSFSNTLIKFEYIVISDEFEEESMRSLMQET